MASSPSSIVLSFKIAKNSISVKYNNYTITQGIRKLHLINFKRSLLAKFFIVF